MLFSKLVPVAYEYSPHQNHFIIIAARDSEHRQRIVQNNIRPALIDMTQAIFNIHRVRIAMKPTLKDFWEEEKKSSMEEAFTERICENIKGVVDGRWR